jgi:hypothetical protein
MAGLAEAVGSSFHARQGGVNFVQQLHDAIL